MNNDIGEIEITIEQARQTIRKGELIRELESYPAFKELIIDGYFRDEASRLVMLKADKEFEPAEKQAKLDRDILGISVLGEYLRTQKLLGSMAEDSLDQHENTLVELREEQANG